MSARAYGVKIARPFAVRRLINVLPAVVTVVLIVVAAVLFVFGEAITQWLGAGLGGGNELESFVVALRWRLIVVCTAAALLTLYRVADTRSRFRLALPRHRPGDGILVAAPLRVQLLAGYEPAAIPTGHSGAWSSCSGSST